MQLLIDYVCYRCDNEWKEVYSSACDSECGKCGAGNVTAVEWVDV